MSEGFEEITEPEDGPELTFREKALRDKFVKEYLQDYDQVAAAMRIGYPKSYAREFAARFMEEPYVAKKIKELEQAVTEEDIESERRRIKAGLVREANYFGPGASQAARVAALSKLAQMAGMDAPTRVQSELTGANGEPLGAGTFVVPGMMTIEEWEKAAADQQAQLTAPDVPTHLQDKPTLQ